MIVADSSQPTPDSEREATARLIAAAPELLAMCRAYVAWLDRSSDRECVAAIGEQMRVVIAKAEGRS